MIFLRSLVFNAWFYGITLVLASAAIVPRMLTRDPQPPSMMRIAHLWARLVLGGLRLICGTRFEVTGLEHVPTDGPVLLASMHQSAFDTVIWLYLLPRACYVLKRELIRIPVFGAMCTSTGMIAVDRDAGAAAIRSLLHQADVAKAANRQIVIFPDGTRMAPGAEPHLQPGVAALAARTGLPVIPVLTDSGSFWGRRAFKKQPGVIRVAIRPPLPAGMPRPALMARLTEEFSTPLTSPA
jgi:1-acyl-sn-glycerol-3-phosphate acyltransferase